MTVGICAVLTAALTVAFSIQRNNDEDMPETTTDVEASVPESTSSPENAKTETKATTKRRSVNNSVVSVKSNETDSNDEVVAVRSNDEDFEASVTKAEKKAEVEASKAADEIPDAEEVEIAPSEVQSLLRQEQSNATCEHKGKYSSMHGSV